MKKRVRIYKAPNGEGKFVNKTAQFLQKAQEGGAPDPSMMGYPGAGKQQVQQATDDQLASVILKDIGNSTPREAIVVKLVNVFGKDPNEAMMLVDQMYQYVEQQQETEVTNADEEEADTDEITAGSDAAVVAQPEQEEEESMSGTDMGNEIALEDTPDDDTDVASGVVMKYGGYYRAQEGMEVPIEMPDVSAYMPQNISDYYGNTDAISQMAWTPPEMTSPDDEADGSQGVPDYTESQMPAEYRMGGAKPSKKQFVNSVLKLVKKQMGGGNETAGKFSNENADPTGSGVRKNNLNKFIGSLKNESAIATAKEQAEKHYEQMMQQQQMSMQQPPMQGYPMAQGGGEQDIYQGQDYENPMHHLALLSQSINNVFDQDQNQVVQAQEGAEVVDELFIKNPPKVGETNSAYLRRVTGNPGIYNNTSIWDGQKFTGPSRDYSAPIEAQYPNVPSYGTAPGINPFNVRPNPLGRFMGGTRMPAGLQGMPPITKLDVRRSGLFGRPRRYTAEFGPSVMPGMGVPGQGAGFYGYGAQTLRWPATRKSVETAANSVNKEALQEVSDATPGSDATTNAADKNTTTTVSTTTDGTVSSNTTPGNTTQTETTTTDGKTETSVVNSESLKSTNKDKDKGSKELKDGYYNYPGKKNVYKKRDGVWYVDTTGTGSNFQPLKSGDVKARISALESNAVTTSLPKKATTPAKPTEPTVQRDQWGRTKEDKYYGFNPQTGKREAGVTQKEWTTKGGNQATSFEGNYNTGWAPMSGNFGSDKNARYQIVRDKDGKIIPSKSFAVVEQSPDYGGTIIVPWNQIPDNSVDTESEDWNNGYGGDMMESKYGGAIYQVGGSTNNLSPDQFGNLQQFVYGGDEYDDITQGDIDDVYSKDTANGDFPMAQFGRSVGRAIRNYFPANVTPQQYTQMQRGAYNPQTGQAQNFVPGTGTYLKSIDVKRSGLLSGAPKKYTITYGNQQMDPSKQNMITLPGSGANTPESAGRRPERRQSDVSGLGARAQTAIRKGERQADRNDRRIARQGQFDDEITTGGNNTPQAQPTIIAPREATSTNSVSSTKVQPTVQPTVPVTTQPAAQPAAPVVAQTAPQVIAQPATQAVAAQANAQAQAQGQMYGPENKKGTIGSMFETPRQFNYQEKPSRNVYDIWREDDPGMVRNSYDDDATLVDESYVYSSPTPASSYYDEQAANDWFEKRKANNLRIYGKAQPEDLRGLTDYEKRNFIINRDLFDKSAGYIALDENGNEVSVPYNYEGDSTNTLGSPQYRANVEAAWNTQSPEVDYDAPATVQFAPQTNNIQSYQAIPGKVFTNRDKFIDTSYGWGVRQKGGALNRFIPRAQNGINTPVSYTDNPALAGMSDVDMISLNPGIEGVQGGINWNQLSTPGANMPTRDQSNDPKQYTVDPNQREAHQNKKVYTGNPEDASFDFKTKNMFNNDAMLNVANAGIRGVTGMIDRARNKKSEAKMYDNLTADNLYASDPSKDRGDYEANSGLYRLDEQGQQWNSRSKRYGGNIYQDGGMVAGQEMFMTDEEIQEFLANGGDLEFI